MRSLRLRLAAAAVAAAGFVVACSDDGGPTTTPSSTPTAVAGGPRLGVQDDRLLWADQDVSQRLDKIKETGARVVRVDLHWDTVAPTRPADATDPADPAYRWERYDAIVDGARARGLTLDLVVFGTPAWAADTSADAQPRSPYYATPFGARPRDPRDAGDFAEAAARRYAPKGVHMWEAWNEPNIPLFLRPQWRREGGRWVPDSPRTYAAILKAMYAGIKRADPDATVAGGVTAPAGSASSPCKSVPPANCRVTPQRFVDELGRPGLRPPMDAYAHHPYPVRRQTDRNNPKATYVDLYNLPVLFRHLDAGYLRGKPVWVTEFGVATAQTLQQPYWRVPEEQKGQLEDALRRMDTQKRVTLFVWYFMQDNDAWKSGLYNQDGSPKPALDAFRAAARGG
ncbi:MAG: cellulase family glycosylhydrolase [Thermoleophilia bacterium]|nr:cellulase family glycosylhydrolase [Thermoleophilia bacterium]